MLLQQLNINNLQVFESVYKHGSMTKAANELFIGQSGVSQHIKNLEDTLEIKLFDRIKNKLIPTQEAKELFLVCSQSFHEIETTLRKLKGITNILEGNITIGLPIEFGNNVIIPLLSEFGKAHPCVTFKIKYGHASDMNKTLLDGQMDFAFVDDYPFDHNIKTEKIYEEMLNLCASKDYLKRQQEKKNQDKVYFESLDYIKFKDNDDLLLKWFKHHYGFSNINLYIRSTLMNIEGASRLITGGLGAGILPKHMANRLKERGYNIHIFRGKKKKNTELFNAISLAWTPHKTMTYQTQKLLNYLKENLK